MVANSIQNTTMKRSHTEAFHKDPRSSDSKNTTPNHTLDQSVRSLLEYSVNDALEKLSVLSPTALPPSNLSACGNKLLPGRDTLDAQNYLVYTLITHAFSSSDRQDLLLNDSFVEILIRKLSDCHHLLLTNPSPLYYLNADNPSYVRYDPHIETYINDLVQDSIISFHARTMSKALPVFLEGQSKPIIFVDDTKTATAIKRDCSIPKELRFANNPYKLWSIRLLSQHLTFTTSESSSIEAQPSTSHRR